MSIPLEHDYIGLSEASLMERNSDKNSDVLNLKETELRLGLPGTEETNTGLNPSNNLISRTKRGFSDAIDASGKWDLSINCRSETDWRKEDLLFSAKGSNGSSKPTPANENSAPQTSKAQVVGWPPIRSFRKNTLATKKNDVEGKSGSSCLYVKVRMDGAPYLRKVDIKTYSNYGELSSALEKMFSCFSIGQCGSDRLPGQEELSESHLMDLLNGSEYVLTYEDKDGDWMLVGDVPWEMFIDSCKRLRIMKSSEAIGLAPRAKNKCKNKN
ncbi:PREDICTED: auxin-responsive protein IAA27-like [Nicotiana attenuata]|uniref:Auxin-responsive protein n=1 Tax=Nicotiana attenuata TaxID=49451 RepID=A0A1J6JPY7_NICAT|nr:PREDICTED: auxin-responsive protein IAA27-like [Nicotiana attenuata]OIT19310.1 auxin-responsive protein iaa27 [Nicotiana attenuata]